MTSLASLTADVFTLTNRPDLVGETSLAIRAATLKAHGSDYYYKDLLETGVQFDLSMQFQTLDYKTLIPRWRALKYIRKFDYSTPPGRAGEFLELITPEQVLDSYSINKEDVCYVAGLQLNIRCRAAFQYMLLGCYVHPDVTFEGYSSWIADEAPLTIIYEAAATVFKTIGYDEQNAAYRQLVLDQYAELKISNIVAIGE
jgi:hypothetical protein